MTTARDPAVAAVARRTRPVAASGVYKEKEESDIEETLSDSSEVEEEEEENAPVWLQDDVDSDVDLDSDKDEEEGDEEFDQMLNQARQQALKEENDSGDLEEAVDESVISLKLKRLDEFVKQSQVYSGIISDTLLDRTKQRQDENAKSSKEPAKKKQKRQSIVDFFKKETQKPADETDLITQNQPSLLQNCVLKNYQFEGLNWLITLYENGLNGILADDMGLGKTIQSIALLAFIYEMDSKGPFLIAAPLSTLDNWVNEFNRFAPSIPVLKYYSNNGVKERTKMWKNFAREHNGEGVVITSYEIIIRDADEIMSKQWKFLIVDEGHRLKNVNSRLIRELKRINTSNRLLLTGTPLQNNLSELWSLLNFIMPDIFADFEIFNKWFDFKGLDLQSSSSKLNKFVNDELEKNLISNLHNILKPFLLRRLKKTALAGILPPKREYLVNCSLTPIQKKFYKMCLKGRLKMTIFKESIKQFFTLNEEHIGHVSNKTIRQFIEYQLNPDQASPNDTMKQMDKLYHQYLYRELKNKKLQNMMMQLRQVVDSTYLFHFPYIHPEDITLDRLLSSSGKLQTLQQLAIPLVQKGHKILIFSQFTNMLDLLEDWCELNELKALRIDGSVDNESRKTQLRQFNDSQDNHNIFLLSTRAAGLGINLTAADTVVLFDSDWNPQVDLQAMDRCYRIGQDKPVIVYRLCCDNTVEHVILTRAINKRTLERMVIQMGKFNTLKRLALNERSFLQQGSANRQSATTNKELVQELSQLLLSGESSIGFPHNENDGDSLTKEEIQELTDRSEKAYWGGRTVRLPHVQLFETTSNF